MKKSLKKSILIFLIWPNLLNFMNCQNFRNWETKKKSQKNILSPTHDPQPPQAMSTITYPKTTTALIAAAAAISIFYYVKKKEQNTATQAKAAFKVFTDSNTDSSSSSGSSDGSAGETKTKTGAAAAPAKEDQIVSVKAKCVLCCIPSHYIFFPFVM